MATTKWKALQNSRFSTSLLISQQSPRGHRHQGWKLMWSKYMKKIPFYNEQSPLKELRHNRPSLGLKIASPPKNISLKTSLSLSVSLSTYDPCKSACVWLCSSACAWALLYCYKGNWQHLRPTAGYLCAWQYSSTFWSGKLHWDYMAFRKFIIKHKIHHQTQYIYIFLMSDIWNCLLPNLHI